MSRYDYLQSGDLALDERCSFYSLIMAAMRRADSDNVTLLQVAFPDTWHELTARYHAPAGHLAGDKNDPDCPFCAGPVYPAPPDPNTLRQPVAINVTDDDGGTPIDPNAV